MSSNGAAVAPMQPQQDNRVDEDSTLDALRNHLSQASQAEAERHSALQATLLAGSLYPPGPLEHGQQQPEHTSQYPLPAPEQQQGDVSQNDMSMQENDGGPGSGGDYPMEDTPVRRGGKGGTKILSDSKRAQQNRAAQRAFRQRKDNHIKQLEERAKALEAQVEETNRYKAENDELRAYLRILQMRLHESSIPIPEAPSSFDHSHAAIASTFLQVQHQQQQQQAHQDQLQDPQQEHDMSSADSIVGQQSPVMQHQQLQESLSPEHQQAQRQALEATRAVPVDPNMFRQGPTPPQQSSAGYGDYKGPNAEQGRTRHGKVDP